MNLLRKLRNKSVLPITWEVTRLWVLMGVLSLLDCDFASSCDVIKDGAQGLFLTMYEVTGLC